VFPDYLGAQVIVQQQVGQRHIQGCRNALERRQGGTCPVVFDLTDKPTGYLGPRRQFSSREAPFASQICQPFAEIHVSPLQGTGTLVAFVSGVKSR
jgi:hypothetical protein